jgi:N-acetylglucosamine-6-phosphate deacetylase
MQASQTILGLDPGSGQPIEVILNGSIIEDVKHADHNERSLLSSGLIDLQINGYAGFDLNDGALAVETVVGLSACLAALGVTSFLPTLVTASQASLLQALAAIAEAREADELARDMIAGVHMEGPSIAPDDGPRGAHPAKHVREPSLSEFQTWQQASGGLVSMVTLAPEHEGSTAFIRTLAEAGICVAIGHTAASAAQIEGAADAGANMSTHLGNGVAGVLPRHPNLLWAQLADDRLYASFIADGHHLPPDTFKSMIRAKGLDRSILVSDSEALGGCPPGRYWKHSGGHEVVVDPEGRIRLAGTPYLAGAALPLIECIPRAMKMAGLTLAQALGLATANPARLLPGATPRGRLAAGCRADIVVMDRVEGRLQVRNVWVNGRRIDAPEPPAQVL